MAVCKLNPCAALIVIFLVFCFCQHVNANALSTPPVELPFYPNKVGGTYAFDVNVVEPLTYSVNVRFYLTLPNKWSHFFDDNPDPQEAKRFYEILGGARNVAPGEWIETGIPAKFRVQIVNKADGNVVVNEIIDHPKTAAIAYGRYASLVKKPLSIGVYSISIEYLEGSAELAHLTAKISFARAHHGK